MLRSPWLGVLAIALAGILGYSLSNTTAKLTLDEVTVTIKPVRHTGAPWDFGGGLPDPRIAIAGVTCEEKDTLAATCKVGKMTERRVHLVVVDVDTSDNDTIADMTFDLADGEHSQAGQGALESIETSTSGGGGPWQRFRALWIALAAGLAIAGGLAWYRKRHAVGE